MAIYFYKRDKEEYGWLSNFHKSPFTLGGITYPTNEHWFQSQKAITPDERLAIAEAASPKEAKQLGRACKMRKDWERVKEHVMLIGLHAKFDQNPELKRKLMETEEEALVEDSPTDSYWGKGADGEGENRLGKLLVMLRSYYRVQCHLVNVTVWKGLVLCTPWIACGKPPVEEEPKTEPTRENKRRGKRRSRR